MTPLLGKILLYALIPTLALVGGGAAALFVRFGIKVRSAILHFAAGVVFSVVAVEILPDVMRLHEPWMTVLGFSAGIVLMLVVRRLTQSPAEGELPRTAPGKLPLAFVIAIGIDIFIDGLLLGIGFSAGAETGVLLALALGVEVLSLGLATATSLRGENVSKGKILSLLTGLSVLFFVSTLGGATLLQNLPETGLDFVLSFALAALMFLVTEELLVEAHEGPETPWLTATFFAGFLLFLILGMVG